MHLPLCSVLQEYQGASYANLSSTIWYYRVPSWSHHWCCFRPACRRAVVDTFHLLHNGPIRRPLFIHRLRTQRHNHHTGPPLIRHSSHHHPNPPLILLHSNHLLHLMNSNPMCKLFTGKDAPHGALDFKCIDNLCPWLPLIDCMQDTLP